MIASTRRANWTSSLRFQIGCRRPLVDLFLLFIALYAGDGEEIEGRIAAIVELGGRSA